MNLATVLPFGLLKLRMSKQSVSDYRKYLKALEKQANCQQRILFLTSCLKNELIPKFLNFRVPSNGCFDPTTVHNFQRRLLRKEIASAKEHQKQLTTVRGDARQTERPFTRCKVLADQTFETVHSQPETAKSNATSEQAADVG